MSEITDNVRSIKQVIPVWDRAHAKLRHELLVRAARGEDVYAYRSAVGVRNVWVDGRRIMLDGGGDGGAA